jgi:hypothetical protein
MQTAWQILLPVLLIAAMSLIIPLAIVLGHRHPSGALLLSGGGSLVAFIALWLVFDGSRLLDGSNTSPDRDATGGVIARGALLALVLAAWTLALNAAAQARRWEWIVLLVLAGFLSFAAVVAVLYLPDGCLAGSPEGGRTVCAYPDSAAAHHGRRRGRPSGRARVRLRPHVPWRAGPPVGLSNSRLGASDAAGGYAQPTDSDLRAEREQ